MSGSGKGVCTSLAISNAITNLCGKFSYSRLFFVVFISLFNFLTKIQCVATIFGQLWRLEPLPLEKKSMWRREMEWLVAVSDHIVELKPSWQTFHDGSKLEVLIVLRNLLEPRSGCIVIVLLI